MVEGRNRQRWEHTSCILALLANIHRDPKRRSQPFTPADFNPYTKQAKQKVKMKAPLAVLKQVFVDRRPSEN